MPSEVIREVSGIIFVGDPHLSSDKPGRRKDDDYATTILNKLEFSIEEANKYNSVVVILGDLFNTPIEEDESLKTRLIRILNRATHRPISNIGNHCTSHATLSDSDTLSVVGEGGCLELIRKSGPVGVIDINGVRIGLGGTPYGMTIPQSVTGMFDDVKSVVWVTHHDLAFDGAYPGSTELFPIDGVKLVVNGHMHLRKKPVKMGGTVWFNPGNITRQTVDCIDHKPTIWHMSETGSITPIPVPHEKNIFDLTGKLVKADKNFADEMESVFVQIMAVELSSDMERTDDGSVIWEKISQKFENDNTSADLKAMITSLMNQVVSEKA